MLRTDEGWTTDEFRFHELCWHSQAELKCLYIWDYITRLRLLVPGDCFAVWMQHSIFASNFTCTCHTATPTVNQYGCQTHTQVILFIFFQLSQFKIRLSGTTFLKYEGISKLRMWTKPFYSNVHINKYMWQSFWTIVYCVCYYTYRVVNIPGGFKLT